MNSQEIIPKCEAWEKRWSAWQFRRVTDTGTVEDRPIDMSFGVGGPETHP